MSHAMAEERPVYIRFEMRAVEDRAASLEAGHYVSKDVPFVIVTPPGGKLEWEGVANEWLANKRNDKFYKHYSECFRAWKDGEAEPEIGTSVRQWPAISPAQVASCIAANIKTIEDLATAPAPALQRIGMGAIALQKKAQAWLQAAQENGKVAEEVTTLRRDNEDLANRVAELTQQVEALLAASGAPRPARARSKKPDEDVLSA